MSSIRFDAPPRDQAQLYNWLFRVSQDLNLALSSIDEQNLTPAAVANLQSGGAASAAVQKDIQTATSALRGMIVKNANEVRHQMDVLESTMQEEFEAFSDYGTVKERVTSVETDTAALKDRQIHYEDEIRGIDGQVAAITETSGYIKVGIIGHEYDETIGEIVPVIGIAIGQETRYTGVKETYREKEYETLDTSKAMGVYTAKGLSFYVGGTEVAYMRDQKLYINKATVADDFEQGPWRWERNANGLTLRYIGVNPNV
jgi:hypothetical protein